MNINSVVIAAALGCTVVSTVSAQATEPQAPAKTSSWELVVPSGTLVPTGAQRDAIKRANMSAVQVMYVPRPSVAVTSTFGWARSRDIVTSGAPKLDVFTYDIGAELRAVSSKKLSAFAGAGMGGRSYNHRKLEIDATHNLSAYASAGAEAGYRRLRVRLEARDYVSSFKPLSGAGETKTGNDVVVLAGLRLVAR